MNSDDHLSGRPVNIWRPSGVTVSAILLCFVLLLIGAFVLGYMPLQRREATVRAEADEREKSLPRVAVMRVSHGSGANELMLPGTMQAVTEAPILARADGYLKRRLVDIGDHVKAGQVLAEIDAPELDQQTLQAALRPVHGGAGHCIPMPESAVRCREAESVRRSREGHRAPQIASARTWQPMTNQGHCQPQAGRPARSKSYNRSFVAAAPELGTS